MIRKLANDQRGVGIVSVLVAMFFVLALGATLLFLSFTGFQIESSELKGEKNFYGAENVMNELRIGIQEVVTESIADAYMTTLGNYSTSTDLEATFQNAFADEIVRRTGNNATPTSQFCERLYKCINLADRNSNRVRNFSIDSITRTGSNVVTIRDVSFSYVGADGYLTTLSTDFVISPPPFSYTQNAYLTSQLSTYALVANQQLKCESNVEVIGDVFAGEIALDMLGTGIEHRDGKLVCGSYRYQDSTNGVEVASTGKVIVSNGASLITHDDSSFWAQEIVVTGHGSTNPSDLDLKLDGTTYVADDLMINGNAGKVKLAGKYIGFGADPEEEDESSSILVNGRNTTLDMGSVSILTLAGYSFIDAGSYDNTPNGTYLMGQSVAGRSDQRAYLVPVSCLSGTDIVQNPCILSDSVYAELTATGSAAMSAIKTETRKYVAEMLGKPVTEITEADLDVALVRAPQPSVQECAVFFFMKFIGEHATVNANAFFAKYFSINSTEINDYLTKYIKFDAYQAPARSITAGHYYTFDGSVMTLGAANSTANSAANYKKPYSNLSTTGIEGVSGNACPYLYHVNGSAVDDLPEVVTPFKDESGNVIGLVINVKNTAEKSFTFPTDYSSDSAVYNKVQVIVSNGDIVLDGSIGTFSGLLMAKGTVTLNANVSSASVSTALEAIGTSTKAELNGKPLLYFFNYASGDTSGNSSNNFASMEDKWNVANLVSYSNWSKY